MGINCLDMGHKKTSAGKERGKRLKFCRKNCVFSTKFIVSILGVSKSTFYRWDGYGLNDVDKLREIARLYNKSILFIAYGFGSYTDTYKKKETNGIIDLIEKSPPNIKTAIHTLLSNIK